MRRPKANPTDQDQPAAPKAKAAPTVELAPLEGPAAETVTATCPDCGRDLEIGANVLALRCPCGSELEVPSRRRVNPFGYRVRPPVTLHAPVRLRSPLEREGARFERGRVERERLDFGRRRRRDD